MAAISRLLVAGLLEAVLRAVAGNFKTKLSGQRAIMFVLCQSCPAPFPISLLKAPPCRLGRQGGATPSGAPASCGGCSLELTPTGATNEEYECIDPTV